MEKDNMNQNNTEQSNTISNNKKPLYKKPWFIAIICIFGVSIIHAAVTNSDTKSVDNSSAVAEANFESSTEAETEKPTEKKTEPPIEALPEEETEPLTEKPTEAKIEEEEKSDFEDEEGFIDGLTDKAGGIVDKFKDKSEEVMDSVKDKADEFLKNDDESDDFIYDGKEEMMGFGIQYEENLIFDGGTITVYLDDNKVFKLEPRQGALIFMPIDDKKHKVRIENNVLHLGTEKQSFTYDKLSSIGELLYTGYKVDYSSLKNKYSLEKIDNSPDDLLYDKYGIDVLDIYWYENGEIEEFVFE